MLDTITIDQQYNGPPNSANGGYCCGLLASYLTGPARVRLFAPPPLDEILTIIKNDDAIEMFHGDSLLARATPSEPVIVVPDVPDLPRAQEAMLRFPGVDNHLFPSCFVCGPERSQDNGLCLFPGPVDDWSLLACSWQPHDFLLSAEGFIRKEIIWAALDCPGYFATTRGDLRPMLLGELEACILADISGQETLIVMSWPMGIEGRKYYGGVAIATQAGEVLAKAKTTWITIK